MHHPKVNLIHSNNPNIAASYNTTLYSFVQSPKMVSRIENVFYVAAFFALMPAGPGSEVEALRLKMDSFGEMENLCRLTPP